MVSVFVVGLLIFILRCGEYLSISFNIVSCNGTAGLGNRRNTARLIHCIFSEGHVCFQFLKFALKIHNITSQIHYTFMAGCFFAVKSETFAQFLCHKYYTQLNVKQFFQKN